MRNINFVNGEIYHIYNRGVEKRNIFLDDSDRFRFIHNIFEFNDTEPATNLYYKKQLYETKQLYEAKPRKVEIVAEKRKRNLIIEILAFALMPNHFHFLIKQLNQNGISNFMHKLGTGYTMYFNQKYERVGSLFQGTYKAVVIKDEPHFIHLPYYIHLNPLDLIMPQWREKEIKDYRKAIKFLENYRWSSFLDYIGKKNFPSVTSRRFLLDFFDGPEQYKADTLKWLKELNLEEVKDVALE